MTEHEAWLMIAEALADSYHNGCFTVDNHIAYGLCDAIGILHDNLLISYSVWKRMDKRLETKKPARASTDVVEYWWTLTKAGNRRRVAVCHELAMETAPGKRRSSRCRTRRNKSGSSETEKKTCSAYGRSKSALNEQAGTQKRLG